MIGALILEIVSNLISPANPFRKWISKRAKRAKRNFAVALPLWRSKISASMGPRRSCGASGKRANQIRDTKPPRSPESKSFQWLAGSRMVCRREACNANANTPTTAPGFATAPSSAQVTNGRAWLLTGSGCQRGRASPSLLLGRHLRHANGIGTGEATGGREGGLATCRPRPPTNKPNHRLARQPGTRRRACVTQLDGPESH